MIDFHLLQTRATLPEVPQHPLVHLHVLPGIQGDVLNGRLLGFNLGSADYVSFIDDDDSLNHGDFIRFIEYLDTHRPDAAYTNSLRNGQPLYQHTTWTREFHLQSHLPVHQLIAVKRDIMDQAIEAFLAFPHLDAIALWPEQVLYSHVAMLTNFVFLPDLFPYNWHHQHYRRSIDPVKLGEARDVMKSMLATV